VGQPAQSLRKPPPHDGGPQPAEAAARKSVVREYAEALGIALVLALIIRTFLVQAYKIPSGSMEPTLLVGDHILVNKIVYGLRLPDSILGIDVPGLPLGHYLFHLEPVHRGDVVVFVFPPDRSKDFIKRAIGVPGDTIQVKNGEVYLNGQKMPDPHAHFEVPPQERSLVSPRDNFGPVTVPPGKLFMMGDNRDRSYDSRFWGFVDRNDVEGRAMIIYWSWDGDGLGILPVRWGRFGMVVH
jgi:signal peptidase I